MNIPRDKTPARRFGSIFGSSTEFDFDALAKGIDALAEEVALRALAIEDADGRTFDGVNHIQIEGVTVTQGPEGSVSIAVNFPPAPFWRLQGYAWDVTDETQILDTTFFNGGNLPVGKTLRAWREWCLGPDGGYRQGGDWVGWVQWNRMGVRNDTGAAQNVSWWVPGVDNTIGSCYHRHTDNSGTIAIAGTAVTGTGTFFTVEFIVGDYIVVGDGANLQVLRIATITDNTNIILANAANAVAAGATYQRGVQLHNHAKVSPATSGTEASGVINIPDGEEGTIHLFFLNEEKADDQNPHLFAFITDALEKVSWQDDGAL